MFCPLLQKPIFMKKVELVFSTFFVITFNIFGNHLEIWISPVKNVQHDTIFAKCVAFLLPYFLGKRKERFFSPY